MLLTALAVLLLQTPSPARSADATSAVAAANAVIAAINAGDGQALSKLGFPEATVQSITVNPDGTTTRRARTLADDAASLASSRESGPIRERIFDPVVTADAGVATVVAPYDFWIKGTLSHCGIDTFTFVKVEGVWKVAALVYSKQTTGCPSRK